MFSKIIFKPLSVCFALAVLSPSYLLGVPTSVKPAESASKKTAIVNLAAIQELLPPYVRWKNTIEKLKNQAAEGLMKQKAELEKEWQKLEGLRGMLPEPKYRAQKEGLEKRIAKLEQSHAYNQQIFYTAEQGAFRRLEQEMQKVLDELCISRGVNIVLNGALVLYVNRSELNLSVLDLTADVARMLEQRVTSLDEYIPNLKAPNK